LIGAVRKLSKLEYEQGNYAECLQLLSEVDSRFTATSDAILSNLWGRISSCIMMNSWIAAFGLLMELKEFFEKNVQFS
jgi:hypothetical protein